jgi:hypothetical protein
MDNGNKPAADPRPVAHIHIGWNPNKGVLDLQSSDLSNMEALGVLFSAALEVYLNTKKPAPESLILPGRPMMPHLKG